MKSLLLVLALVSVGCSDSTPALLSSPTTLTHDTRDGLWNAATGLYTPRDPSPHPGLAFNPQTGWWLWVPSS